MKMPLNGKSLAGDAPGRSISRQLGRDDRLDDHGHVESVAQNQRHEFSLEEESNSWGVRLAPSRPILMVFWGTTQLRIAYRLYGLTERQCGRFPGSIQFLGVDVSTEAVRGNAFPVISDDVDGAGTAAFEGQSCTRRIAPKVADQAQRLAARLDHSDPRAPASCSRDESIRVCHVVGSGGAGGGGIQPGITAVHAGVRRAVRGKIATRVIQIGPEIALRDVNRSPSENQGIHARENIANNQTRFIRDFRSSGTLTEELPGIETISRQASERVTSLVVIDQSNGRHTISTVDDFIGMAARGIFLTVFTHADGWIAARRRDLDVLGDTVWGRIGEPEYITQGNQGDES